MKTQILNPFRMRLDNTKTERFNTYSDSQKVLTRHGVTIYNGYCSFDYTYKGVLIGQRAGMNQGRAKDIIDKVTGNFTGPIYYNERFCMYRMFNLIKEL